MLLVVAVGLECLAGGLLEEEPNCPCEDQEGFDIPAKTRHFVALKGGSPRPASITNWFR